MADVKKEVESLLFASGRAMLVKDLADIIQAKPKDVEKAVQELKAEYDSRDTSMTLMETADGWKMNVKERYVSLVTKIVADTELPFPLLETLSVIAYKAPAWQAEVIKVRGTNAYEHIQQLIDAGFIDRRKKGRSFELILTPKFFEYFDVQGDKSLKMMFQDVKPSEPSPRIKKSKVGDLPVVDIPGEQKAVSDNGEPVPAEGTLGGLEVVDVKPKHHTQFKPDNDFIDDIDARIANLSKRNDELDSDEAFQKPAGEGGQQPGEAEFEPPENEKMKEIFGEHEGEQKKPEEEADSDEGEKAEEQSPFASGSENSQEPAEEAAEDETPDSEKKQEEVGGVPEEKEERPEDDEQDEEPAEEEEEEKAEF